MKRIIVLAGNSRQFRNWVEDKISKNNDKEYEHNTTKGHLKIGDEEFIYVEDQNRCRGQIVDQVITVGTFWDRKDAHDFYQMAESRVWRSQPSVGSKEGK